jgi:hypothetical protein
LFNPRPHIVLRQLENLTRTAVTVCDFAEGQRAFRSVAFLPKIVQTVNEQRGSDVRFFLSSEGINRLGSASLDFHGKELS